MIGSIKRECRSGFTFIELVIAIAILGILAIVVVPNVMQYLGEAKENTTTTNLQTLKGAVDNYMRKINRPPQTLKDLIRRPADLTKREWRVPFIEGKEVPKDGWGNPFQYKVVHDQTPIW